MLSPAHTIEQLLHLMMNFGKKKTRFCTTTGRVESVYIWQTEHLSHAVQATSSCWNGRCARWVWFCDSEWNSIDSSGCPESSLPNPSPSHLWRQVSRLQLSENWLASSLQKLKPNWTFFWGSKKFNYLIINQIGHFPFHGYFFKPLILRQKHPFPKTIQALSQILCEPLVIQYMSILATFKSLFG